MNLRGHHLLCAALFSGHGYNQAFTEKMTAIVEAMKTEEEIKVLEGADEICSACPNLLTGGGCALGTEDVLHRDKAAQEVLGLPSKSFSTPEKIRRKLYGLTKADFEAVCGGCRWKKEGLCSWDILHRRVKP